MRIRIDWLCVGLLAAMLWQPAFAAGEGAGSGGGNRQQGGGINYAPEPAVYSVTLVDPKSRTVRLRAADGRTGTVYVSEDVYDLSKLKNGDKVRIDFVVPDGKNSKLRAATVWPVK